MTRFVVRELHGYLTHDARRPGHSYIVQDTRRNFAPVAIYRSEDYAREGQRWAREGAHEHAANMNAAHEREATQAASGTAR